MLDEETLDGDNARICDVCGAVYVEDYCTLCEELGEGTD